MRTTGLKFPINTPGNKNAKCADSNHLSKPNGFFQCMVRFKTCSELAATISKQFTIHSSGGELFPIGERLLVPTEKRRSGGSFRLEIA